MLKNICRYPTHIRRISVSLLHGYGWPVRDMYRGGRGGGRGWDSGSYGRRRNDRGGGWHNFSSDSGSKGHPPELKGKQIGMWYANRSQANKRRKERAERPVVSIGGAQEEHIQRLLQDIRSSEECPPQPERSGASLTDSEEEDWCENSVQKGPSADKVKQELFESSCPSSSQYFSDQNMPGPSSRDPSEEKRPVTAGGHIEQLLASSADGPTFDDEVGEQEEEGMTEEGVPKLTEILNFIKEETDFMIKMEAEEEDMLGKNPWVDSALDRLLQDELIEKEVNPKYEEMQIFRRRLPSYKMKDVILDVIRNNQCVVISGETGCGKTTQVPQFILDDYIQKGIGSHCRVVCTQPRRISAVSVAERVAVERAEECGISSGYMIRLEHKLSRPQGSILFCTAGILLKFLESDPLLERASHIILDEIHERDLQSDFLMIILKDLLPKRPELKLILMSATLNAESFSKYFYKCPMLNISGFTFPVKEYLLEDVVEMLRYQSARQSRKKSLPVWKKKSRKHRDDLMQIEEEQWMFDAWLRDLKGNYSPATIETLRNMDLDVIDLDLIKALIRHIVLNKRDGAILVFVPGWEEITILCKMLLEETMFNSGKFMIIPLHSMMPTLNQKQVFDRPPPGFRKIVIATNIAETSITIDDVVYVIDCGKIKVKDFQPENNLATLEPQWVSKANAKQRRGRAGSVYHIMLGFQMLHLYHHKAITKPDRAFHEALIYILVQAGECYHLYTSLKEHELRDFLPPEILRTRLEELCLNIKLLKLGQIEPFVSKAMNPPSLQALHSAVVTLQNLNALDQDENLLPLGYHLARMPLDPHMGKMILFGAMFCCLDPILTIAASLSFKDAFYIPMGKEANADRARRVLSDGSKSDHIMLVKAFEGWERSVARGTNRQYCWDNFLTEHTLKLLRDMKRQLAELLYDVGFISSKNPKDRLANQFKDNMALVKAVVCAGLYPNVAKIQKVPGPKANKFKLPKVITLTDDKIGIHPKSVNAQERQFESKWLVYHKKLKTTQVFLHDCSMVSPYPLLFFGGKIGTLREEDQECVSVDTWIVFKASFKTAQLVKDLRNELDKLLEEKINKPGITNWDPKSKEGSLLRAILDLVTTEDLQYQARDNVQGYRQQDYR